LKRKIITTSDGSKTIHIEQWNEQYHSIHGAIQEAKHVFISTGLEYFVEKHKPKSISILEIGFGTGLNALLTCMVSDHIAIPITYIGVEAYPVVQEELEALNYCEQLNVDSTNFEAIHHAPWEQDVLITPNFTIQKQQRFFKDIKDISAFDLIYFDAFGARVQPELWTESIFSIMYKALKPNGVLVTYSAKGSVRRAMLAVGFEVERLPGPPGKREMLRATKIL